MKKVLIIGLLMLISNSLFSQKYLGTYSELFFGRQSSAKIEAMGQSSTAVTGDLSSVYFNPAGISNLKGAQVYNNISRGFFFADSAVSNFFGFGSKIGEKWAVAYNLQSFKNNLIYVDANGNIISIDNKPDLTHKLTCSFKPIKTLAIGISANLLDPLSKNAIGNILDYKKIFYLDFGITKELNLFKNKIQNHTLNLGASLTNFNYSKSRYNFNSSNYVESLPVINRYGINYDFVLSKNWLIDSLNTCKISVIADYSFLLNSKYYSGYNVGCQLELFEFLSARIGYYSKSNDTDQYLQILKRKNVFTYGFGLSLPIYKLTKIPLQVNFDYCNLPQDNSSTSPTNFNFPNFNCFTGSIKWLF